MAIGRSNKFYIIIILGIVVAFFLMLHMLKRDPLAQPVMDNPPWALHTVQVTQGTVTDIFPALGKVHSSSDMTIAPQISGTVRELGPRAGGKVKTGDLLVQIDTRELDANRDALKAQLVSAENAAETAIKEYQRVVKLLADGWETQSNADKQETQRQGAVSAVTALKNQIKALDIKISYGRIITPVKANIIARYAEIGDTVFPGKPIYVLSAHEGGRVIVPIPLSTLVNVKPGDDVELLNDNDVIKAHITRINPSLDKYSMGSLEIDLLERPFNLPDSSPIRANVITREVLHNMIVPEDALVPSDETIHRTLFRIREGNPQRLVKTPVDVALCGREGCAISGKITPNDSVVRGHGSILLKLRDGDAIDTSWKAE